MAEDVTESVETDTPDSSVEVQQEPTGEAYTVKVDGEEREVSLNELRDGYQRQSDYTRKTQDLAAERKRLQQAEAIVAALESDPAGTLNALGDAFGVQGQPAAPTDPYGSGWDEPEDPTAQRISQLENRLEQQDRLHRQQQLEKQVQDLRGQYGDFDSDELYQHALSHRIGNLEAALTHMRYGDVASRAEKLEKEQERTEAKRGASVVEPSGSKQAGSSTSSTSPAATSLREAFAAAKKEHAS
jgi:hypothetical protein